MTEPMGSKKPTVAEDGRISEKKSGQAFSLFCHAQGFPIPTFR